MQPTNNPSQQPVTANPYASRQQDDMQRRMMIQKLLEQYMAQQGQGQQFKPALRPQGAMMPTSGKMPNQSMMKY